MNDGRKRIEEGCLRLLNFCMTLYWVGMFGIYPLFYNDRYFDMGEAKYQFVKYFSMVVMGIALLLVIVWLVMKERRKYGRRDFSLTDIFVSAYAVVTILSYLATPYKDVAFWGYSGWYMGLASQILFILIYYLISRFLSWNQFLLLPMLVSSALVFLFAVLQRFGIDILGMYEGVSESQIILFLSTLGQATWFSSYLCLMFPVGLFLYWHVEKAAYRAVMAVYVCLGYLTIVTQNSDSAFFALGAILLVLFSCSFRENQKMQRFLELLVLGAGSFLVIGFLQKILPDRAVPLEPLSLFFSQSRATAAFFAAAVMALIVFCLWNQKNIRVERLKWLRTVVFWMVGTGAILTLVLIWMTTTGRLPESLRGLEQVNYLNFNSDWGNGRGFSWQISWRIYWEYPWLQKLIGCGPDSFAAWAYEYYRPELVARWGDNVLTNAHNEWLTSLLFFGLTGLLAYAGIFISQFAESVKKVAQKPEMIAVAMCIAAYCAHNLFCYQQIICTPIMFMILGVGQSFLKREREGNDAL